MCLCVARACTALGMFGLGHARDERGRGHVLRGLAWCEYIRRGRARCGHEKRGMHCVGVYSVACSARSVRRKLARCKILRIDL
jgi:hypothetical protein